METERAEGLEAQDLIGEQAGVTTPAPVETPAPRPSPAPEVDRIAELKRWVAQQQAAHDAEVLKRVKDSLRDRDRSILEKVDERFVIARRGLDQAEQAQLLTPQDAETQRNALRQQIQAETVAEERKRTAQEQAREQTVSNEMVAQVQAELTNIWRASGLDESDPEARELPQDLSQYAPLEAIRVYGAKVDEAKRKKEARNMKPKQEPKPAAPAPELPYADVGGGASVPAPNADAIIAQIEQVSKQLTKTPVGKERQRLIQQRADLQTRLEALGAK